MVNLGIVAKSLSASRRDDDWEIFPYDGNCGDYAVTHAASQSETIAVPGDWGPGDHTVLVHFLNDHWDGTPDTDRNLYVESVSFNGTNLPQGAIGNVLGQFFSFHDLV